MTHFSNRFLLRRMLEVMAITNVLLAMFQQWIIPSVKNSFQAFSVSLCNLIHDALLHQRALSKRVAMTERPPRFPYPNRLFLLFLSPSVLLPILPLRYGSVLLSHDIWGFPLLFRTFNITLVQHNTVLLLSNTVLLWNYNNLGVCFIKWILVNQRHMFQIDFELGTLYYGT